MQIDDLLGAWRANCSVNFQLLNLCSDDDLELKPGKGKTIRSNFVHIVGIRRAHIEDRMPKDASSISKLDWKEASRQEIVDALKVSDQLIEKYLTQLEEIRKPAKWTPARFLAYNVAHEANHRSQIEIALRLNGREPSIAELYRLWDGWKVGVAK